MSKLGQGLLDLHSKRGAVDLDFLAGFAEGEAARLIAGANTAKHAFEIAEAAGFDLAAGVAEAAWYTAAKALGRADCDVEIVIFDRDGGFLARTGFLPAR